MLLSSNTQDSLFSAWDVVSLPQKSQIQLLHLKPSSKASDALQAYLQVLDLEDQQSELFKGTKSNGHNCYNFKVMFPYVEIHDGDSTRNDRIQLQLHADDTNSCVESHIPIPIKLAQILRTIRSQSPDSMTILWIEFICTNDEDTHGTAHQMTLRDEILASSSGIFFCTENRYEANESFDRLSKLMRSHQPEAFLSEPSKFMNKDDLALLVRFMNDPCFSRYNATREIVMMSSATLIWDLCPQSGVGQCPGTEIDLRNVASWMNLCIKAESTKQLSGIIRKELDGIWWTSNRDLQYIESSCVAYFMDNVRSLSGFEILSSEEWTGSVKHLESSQRRQEPDYPSQREHRGSLDFHRPRGSIGIAPIKPSRRWRAFLT